MHELGQASNFNQSINWHHRMQDHAESSHLTTFDSFRVIRHQVMDLETVQNPYKGIKSFIRFCDNCKISSFMCTNHMKESELKIMCLTIFKSITEFVRISRVYVVVVDSLKFGDRCLCGF